MKSLDTNVRTQLVRSQYATTVVAFTGVRGVRNSGTQDLQRRPRASDGGVRSDYL